MSLDRAPECPIVRFSAGDVDARAYRALRPECLKLRFLPTFMRGSMIDGGMVEPENEVAVTELRRATHCEIRRFGIREKDFDRAVGEIESAAPSVGYPEHSADPGRAEEGALASWPETWDFHRRSPRDTAAEMVRCAFEAGASDLILDEQDLWMDVAFKLGGTKEILPPIEKEAVPALFRAFKEMAGLPTEAVSVWQTGAASIPVEGGRRADLRIEITPTLHGESLVARIHDRERQLRRMRRLPFSDPGQRRLAEACLRQRQGLIVATGPTGQGKTTTLYACLGQLDSASLNIRTLEDPVEFAVPWITQIPVASGTNRSYADGLRSLLRQAPDVILLGEIRDGQTARVCVEAVDTGHLILSTLHTRDALGVVARLLDLGLSGRQIGGSLLLAIGQRLVRRLCPGCRRPIAPTPEQKRRFERQGIPPPEVLQLPVGCARCGGRGERGVVPVFELFHPAPHGELTDAIARTTSADFGERSLRERWIALGGSPLVRQGLRLAAAGDISYSEAAKLERDSPE